MNIVDLIPGYIKHVLENDNYVLYHKMYPELFEHYYKFWSKLNVHNTRFDRKQIIDSRNRIVSFIKKNYEALKKYNRSFKELKVVLFVGDGFTNGHAFKDKDKLVVWIPVETYSNNTDIQIFVTHELLHGIHYLKVPEFYFTTDEEKRRLSRQLITEGLASYGTQRLTGVSEETALWGDYLTGKKLTNWMNSCEKEFDNLKKFAKENYDSTENGQALFWAADENDIYKYRAGYYLGMKLLQQLDNSEKLGLNGLLSFPRFDLEAAVYELL